MLIGDCVPRELFSAVPDVVVCQLSVVRDFSRDATDNRQPTTDNRFDFSREATDNRQPTTDNHFSIAVLTSKRAPGLDALRDRVSVACVVHRQPLRGRDRKAFDAETAAMLRAFNVDAVLLLGYLYVITEPLLAAFPDRILNVHDADLTLRNADGTPRYAGLHATRDAILAGEHETRSSVHLVTAQLDGGPVIARSEAFPVAPFVHEAAAHGEHDIVRAYAYAQREWMMRSTWGALAADALKRVAMEAVA